MIIHGLQDAELVSQKVFRTQIKKFGSPMESDVFKHVGFHCSKISSGAI